MSGWTLKLAARVAADPGSGEKGGELSLSLHRIYPQAGGARYRADRVPVDYQTIVTPAQLDEWIMRIDAAPVVSAGYRNHRAGPDAGAARRHRVFG